MSEFRNTRTNKNKPCDKSCNGNPVIQTQCGEVTTGEIGEIKKEIIFTGDVLNTVARIQRLCNIYDVDILISDDLMKRLNPDSSFQIKTFGESQLRGKDNKIELFTTYRV